MIRRPDPVVRDLVLAALLALFLLLGFALSASAATPCATLERCRTETATQAETIQALADYVLRLEHDAAEHAIDLRLCSAKLAARTSSRALAAIVPPCPPPPECDSGPSVLSQVLTHSLAGAGGLLLGRLSAQCPSAVVVR